MVAPVQLIFISGSLRRSSLQVALLAGSRNTFTQTFVPFSNIDSSLSPYKITEIGVITGTATENEYNVACTFTKTHKAPPKVFGIANNRAINVGVNNISELPSTFFEDQFRNWDYKLTNGESVNEVSKRMNEALSEILDVNRDKKIAIISHGTAISAMLKKWCNIKLNEETKLVEIYFNNKLVFDGNWKCPELFKLEFDDNNNLISIKNIKFK